MPPSRVEILDSERARVYVDRGENLLSTAKQALAAGNPDGAATSAIQCVVAFADGFTVWHLRQRSRGQDHHEVIGLIARVRSPASQEVAKFVQLALDRKNEVEYGSRRVREADALHLVDNAEKLAKLVRTSLQVRG